MPQIYKTFTKTDIGNKASVATNTTQNQKISEVLSTFVTLFKAKHL